MSATWRCCRATRWCSTPTAPSASTADFTAVLARLPAGQAVQLYVEARPLALDAVVQQFLNDAERALTASDGETADGASRGALADVHAESLRFHAAEHAAISVRHSSSCPPWRARSGAFRRPTQGHGAPRG